MLKNIIKKYAKDITKEDIINYAERQNTSLNDYEVNIIYEQINNNLDNLIKDPIYELKKIKDKLKPTTYLKINELINLYKNYL